MSDGSVSDRFVLIGEGALLVQCADRLIARGHTVGGIVSSEPQVLAWAGEHGVPVVPWGEDVLPFLKREPFDYLLSIVNLRMLSDDLLALPRKMAINFHDSPLPRYAGLYATTWALFHDEDEHGVTWHEMTPGADEGRLLKQKRFPISDGETAFSLNAKCFTAGIESFDELADELTRDALAPVAQDMSARSYFGRHDRPGTSCVVDLSQPAAEVARLVRALDLGEAYPNPVGVPRFAAGDRWFFARGASVAEGVDADAPGAVAEAETDALVVGTGDGAVRLTDLCTPAGATSSPRELGVAAGDRLLVLDDEARTRLGELADRATRAEPSWRLHLLGADPIEPALTAGDGGAAEVRVTDAVRGWADADSGPGGPAVAAGALALLARLAGSFDFRVGLVHDELVAARRGYEGLFASTVPLRLPLDPDAAMADAAAVVRGRLDKALPRGPLFRDVFAREPALAGRASPTGEPRHAVVLHLTSAPDDAAPAADAALTLVVAADGARVRVLAGEGRELDVAGFAARLESFLSALAAAPDTPLGRLPVLTDEERALLLEERNRTATELPETTVLSLIEEQANKTPDAPAVSSADRTLTYRALDERANALAHRLVDAGVTRGDRVGVLLERSERLQLAVLAVMKAGAAYVPLDPAYPRDRLELMAEDAKLAVVVTEEACARDVPGGGVTAVRVDDDETTRRDAPPAGAAPAPDDLAYVVYTSGSTGRPKGVMVEHRNAVAFFVAMDERLGADPGVWLAVTSLSFDISVLELFWTLARGFHVVVYAGDDRAAALPGPYAADTVDFSAFYFSSDASEAGLSGKYQLLLEGARFADSHGFSAIWTPERHFHAFGGLYPNPSVTSAAVATITKNVGLRAGSCVSPLHSPIRVAEEWSVVDNLSGGRVGISFASGWQPNDFVLKPDAFHDRKQRMFDDIDTVRALWRGESVTFQNGTGDDTEVRILPRPVQPELPVWVTAAGNPETFRGAAQNGCNILTHLLGQTPDEVAEKIALYRKTWKEAGHKGEGIVSLMLHTFVGPDADAAKEAAREPMKQYLSSAVGLIKAAAWSFPTFKQQTTLDDGSFGTDHLGEEEMDALLDHAFERYYATSGLFGDVRRARETAAQVAAVGVDDIACLIDFGIATPQVLEHLPWLDEVRQAFAKTPGRRPAPEGFDGTVAGLIERHGVTHLQCTPSMASMLLADERTRGAVAGLARFLVGGEALPVALAEELASLVEGGEVHNMYGPTETTIWSTTWRVHDVDGAVSIGTPIANTQVYVVDARLEPVPPGTPGELCIGGRAVVRGYLDRPELTAERFPADPFTDGADARLYRTGDLVRWRDDGQLEFLGRLDHQVKIRGYRMELGEIETVLAGHPDVKQAVVLAREDTPGDKRLVAYLRAGSAGVDEGALRARAEQALPDYMVPSAFVQMAAFPETPNRKVDRKAFPPPEELQPRARAAFVAPTSGLEEVVAGVWRDVLGVDEVGVNDNFFDLGGHSLLTIQVLNRLKEKVEQPLSLVDLFRLPTIRALTEHLESGPDEEGLKESAARGDRRREAMKRRARRRR